MLDPKLLRTDLDSVAAQLARRGFTLNTVKLTELEARRKDLQVKTQDLQGERNSKSKSIGKAKAAGEDIQPLLAEVAGLGDQLTAAENELAVLQGELNPGQGLRRARDPGSSTSGRWPARPASVGKMRERETGTIWG